MKLTESNDQLLNLIQTLWDAETSQRLDPARPPEALDYLIQYDPTSQWYMAGRAIFILTGITGLNGNLMALNLLQVDRDEARADMLMMMERCGLRRLSTTVPVSQKEVRDAWKGLGFRVEGRARDAGVIDGHFIDVWFLGIRHPEVAYNTNRGPTPPKEQGDKRKRRRRRGKKNGASTEAPSVES